MIAKNQNSYAGIIIFLYMMAFGLIACTQEDDSLISTSNNCDDVDTVKPLSDRGECSETLGFANEVSVNIENGQRVISSNSIPDHAVGLFGRVEGSLNPNAIGEIPSTYRIPTDPELTGTALPLLSTDRGPQYEFGLLLNGVLLDPEAAEPWPHDGIFSFSEKNWNWNLDAMSINLGLDCNNAHVQPTGKYHYHGAPTLYLESLNISADAMTLVGYAADGFPIYYKYGFSSANDLSSGVVALQSSYRLKSGERPGDGDSAPCGSYSGIYTNDYEYIEGLGDLDECNGRYGVTQEYPSGTYYYVITESYPFVSRCLQGTPSDDFKLQ